MSWKIRFFQTARGNLPVKEFISQQDLATQAKISHAIGVLMDYGPYLKPPYVKKIRNKLYELRTSGKLPIRLFYTLYKNEYYLLHAFKKKSQKLPTKEIKIALDRIKGLI